MRPLFHFDEHIGDWRVLAGPKDIACGAIGTCHIQNGAVTWEKLSEDVQQIIVKGGGEGAALSKEFGLSDLVGITQRTLTLRFEEMQQALDDLQRQIDEIVAASVNIEASFSPQHPVVGIETDLDISVGLSKEATSIKVLVDGQQIGTTGSGLTHEVTYHNFEATSKAEVAFRVEAVVYGVTRTKTFYLTPEGHAAGIVWMKNHIEVSADSVVMGEVGHVYPDVYNPNGVTGIVYSSTNGNVATINAATGVITLRGVGQTTIKATYDGDDDPIYKSAEISYLLTVTEDTSARDYYVGWATGNDSSFDGFAALTATQLKALATGYKKASKPSITKTVTAAEATGSRQIFFLMWKQGTAPASGSVTSGGITENLSAADFLDTSVFRAEHTDVVIDDTAYHVAGMRGAFDAGDIFVVNF